MDFKKIISTIDSLSKPAETLTESVIAEKAESKAQQKAAGAALAAKKSGDTSKLKGASKEMAKMSKKELEKVAGTKHKGLPEKKKTKESFDAEAFGDKFSKMVEAKKGSKPDFLDLDGDGDTKEPMKKAAKEKKMKEGWDDMLKAAEKKKAEKGTGKFDSKKTSTGTVYTRKASTFDDGGKDSNTKKAEKKAKKTVKESIGSLGRKRVANVGQLDITAWLRQSLGLPKDAPVYFDDADLVWGDATIVPRALVDGSLTLNDLLKAFKVAVDKHPDGWWQELDVDESMFEDPMSRWQANKGYSSPSVDKLSPEAKKELSMLAKHPRIDDLVGDYYEGKINRGPASKEVSSFIQELWDEISYDMPGGDDPDNSTPEVVSAIQSMFESKRSSKKAVKESVERKLSFRDMMKLVVESGGQQQIDPIDQELFAWATRVAKNKLGEGMKAEVYAGMIYERMGGVFEMYDVLSEDKE